MRVRVLYFAAVREMMGKDEELVELPPSAASVQGFVAHLARLRPELAACLPTVRVALNEAFAAPAEALAEGDVLALIPPVAGG